MSIIYRRAGLDDLLEVMTANREKLDPNIGHELVLSLD
jgi:hypothetical protein